MLQEDAWFEPDFLNLGCRLESPGRVLYPDSVQTRSSGVGIPKLKFLGDSRGWSKVRNLGLDVAIHQACLKVSQAVSVHNWG